MQKRRTDCCLLFYRRYTGIFPNILVWNISLPLSAGTLSSPPHKSYLLVKKSLISLLNALFKQCGSDPLQFWWNILTKSMCWFLTLEEVFSLLMKIFNIVISIILNVLLQIYDFLIFFWHFECFDVLL